jgi:YegS/Rv2252/BmrU family lipid kinase
MPNPFKRVQIITNPAAGQDEPILKPLNNVFQKYGATWDIDVTQKEGDGERLAREAVADGADVVVAYGGDGTALEVANGLVGSNVPLAVLPGGTANAFATELGIPKGALEQAAEIIFTGEPRAVDMGRSGDYHFMLRVDMGVSTKISEEASREMKDRFGILAYALSAFRAISQAEKIRYYLTLDGEKIETEGVACLVANVNDLGAFNLTLTSKVDFSDGLLDVFVLASVAEGLVSAAANMINLQEGAAATFQHWQARDILIECDPPQKVWADGDPFSETPLHVTIAPQAIQVLVPRAT